MKIVLIPRPQSIEEIVADLRIADWKTKRKLILKFREAILRKLRRFL